MPEKAKGLTKWSANKDKSAQEMLAEDTMANKEGKQIWYPTEEKYQKWSSIHQIFTAENKLQGKIWSKRNQNYIKLYQWDLNLLLQCLLFRSKHSWKMECLNMFTEISAVQNCFLWSISHLYFYFRIKILPFLSFFFFLF